MASRFSAARPKRAAEAFARARHGEDEDDASISANNKKVRFDVRNPSALAPSASREDDEDEDEVLAADVIGGSSRTTKRNAVNIDGYDSDSDNENFEARAEARKSKNKNAEDVDLAQVMDTYNSKDASGGADGEDDEVDMFGGSDDDDDAKASKSTAAKKRKDVRFLSENDIEGQEGESKSGGHVRIDTDPNNVFGGSDDEDDDDNVAIEDIIAEEGLDEEVGLGGLKKHAPKIDAFNMRQEQEEGAFDEAGNFIRKTNDADAVHDRWLEGLSKKDMKKAAAAREKRDAELRQKQRENDSISTTDLLKALILLLEPTETPVEALARLGKAHKKPKKVPMWKQKKLLKKLGADAMDVDVTDKKGAGDPKQDKIKEAIENITDAADKLLGRDYPKIYEIERERLIRDYSKETGEPWAEPPRLDEEESPEDGPKMWEFRWTDGRDQAAKQGPFDGPTMKAWQDAGYFGEGVEFRVEGDDHEWSSSAITFT
ncbi:hypothetical protein B0H63DRAFT_145301 [Podospora didyma]|uniref:GYF domain-containing protein n=1 Tax=Podospora didyma TaxID=330526 RepID=A0AAE0NSU7_9PEZI|nr:hypothetical protein B0H63DRAFT_145301 [Podospora didyma]